jgi:hypothetical protein
MEGVRWKKENYGIDVYTNRRKIIENICISDIKDFMKTLLKNSHFCETLMQPM